jgi:hypothetical protein
LLAGQLFGRRRAQDGRTVELTVRLRAGDGTAVIGEAIVLQRLPDEEEIGPACRTDTGGACRWPVSPGLYQLLFDRPPDELSALALAEGGLRGLGITVGAAPITYHITLHSDGRVYFDGAPEAAVPRPIIPEWADLGEERPVTPEPASVALLPIQPAHPRQARIPRPEVNLPSLPGGWCSSWPWAWWPAVFCTSTRAAARPPAAGRVDRPAEKPSAQAVRVIDQEDPDA